ncbi:MAG: 23S rRNA (uracil(1939)-C(5))-methyltransferase RlmD [Bacillota bacterium]
MQLEVTGLGHGGEGVARHDGMAVFVPGAMPGDVVTARFTDVRTTYVRAELVSIDRPAADRVEARCPIYEACGGCQLQHVSYPRQLALKTQQVKDALQRIGHLDPALVRDTIGAQNPWNYRNKAQFPVGLLNLRPGGGPGASPEPRVVAGLYARGTHQVIDADACLIQNETNNRILAAAKGLISRYGYPVYDERSGAGLVRHVLARVGTKSGQAMAVLVTAERRLPRGQDFARDLMAAVPGLVTVVQNVNPRRTNVVLGEENITLAGPGAIEDELLGLTFSISPRSFFQVNPEQTEVLYCKALEFAGLSGDEFVVDAYCGIGTISLCLARRAGRVLGIEEVPEAIDDARENAIRNRLSNAEFRVGTVEEWAPRLAAEGLHPDVVVVDPPRAGVEASALDAFVQMGPKRIVYVSCNPATLARDLAHLTERGYRCKEIQPVDMFPHTSHVECVALLPQE